ncbi:efflux RND transporter permease subunit [Aliiglaciecola sp. CAU 1673]|uniref:efflux RND transporter permease subunit n=1 Tax=Aliiglaciecola sp. CAU 1673 TaxID=3032595 RepID=UPI0023DA16D9|nr:efflux RND transporter permease subunit [Aliiglaciecola sp. CAU 1673]MDF2176742.1 efflux RND transporter permease subunit [Aliiglaciecola sp. CAU 1673]
MFASIVRHGILVTVIVLIVAVLGIVAAMRIPVQMIPDLEVRTITVQTRWPGATPQDIEKEILIEQEEFLQNIPYLQQLTASASLGQAEIELEFPFGVDITETLIRVNNALTQVPSYPLNVDEPRVYATSFSANAFMYFRVSPLEGNPRNLDMDMMRDYIEDQVRNRMSSVPGVAEVNVGGGAQRQIQIRLDPERLAAKGLTLNQVRSAINARNRDVSAGEVESGKRRYLLRTIGRFSDLEDIRKLILVREGDSLVRLGDVATVTLDHFKIRQASSVNGKPVISLSVRRESGSNVITIKEAMMQEVALINSELLGPRGMVLELTADDVVYVEDSVFNVWKNLALGALLATVVMFLFLRSFRATALGVVGIPICTIAAFLGLLLAGRTINVISLAGIAFAIGMTLDNSIVVLESIELERRKGLDRLKAAVAGVQKVWPAVLASTLTTVMVFLPVIFIQEEAGQLYSDVAIAISAAILVSMLIAITVIPTASARLSFGSSLSDKDSSRASSILAALFWLIETPKRRFACVGVTVLISTAIVYFLTPPAEYLPEGEEPKTFAFMSAPPGYNLKTMEQIGQELTDYFMPFVGDDPKRFARGETTVPAMAYLNMGISPNGLRIISQTIDPGQIDALMQAIVQKYESYPGMRAFAARGSIISSNDGGTRSVNLDISGPNLADLFNVARKAYDRAKEAFENPSIQSNPSSLTLAQPLLQIEPDWDRLAEVGMSAQDIGFAVAALTDGAFVSEFFMGDDKIDMYLYNNQGPGADIGTLNAILLQTPSGDVLPLSDLAYVREIVDTSTIRRVDGRRTVTLNIIPPRTTALETGVAMVKEEVVAAMREAGDIPLGVELGISGAADQLDATRESLSSNYIVALVIVYLLMVAIFNHWGYPLLIMTSIPLGVAGGIAGLALLNGVGQTLSWLGLGGVHQPFDMISMLGFLILMGTVVNNPILIVHRAIDNVKEQAMDAVEAVKEAVQSRLRPIAISSITTIFGLAPLVFLPGVGSELYRGVGAIVMAGIIGATLVTLTMLPALTVMVLHRWQENTTTREL